MICPSCSAELPADARFCVECGAEVSPAATGATTVLPRYSATAVICRACGAAGPEGAAYCVRCGRHLSEPFAAAPQPQRMVPITPPHTRRPRTQRPHRTHSSPSAAPAPSPFLRKRDADKISGAILLIGMGVLFLSKLPFWPLILFVVGLSVFVGSAVRGRVGEALAGGLFFFGLAVLFRLPHLLVPGMIALVGITTLLRLAMRRARWP
jgi:ribosomal protein L40E